MPQDATRTRRSVRDRLHDLAIVAVLREASEARARRLAEALLDAGIGALEVTTNTPGCFEILESLARRPQGGRGDPPVLGVGTVLSHEHVTRARDAGASFVVSPHVSVGGAHLDGQTNLIEAAGAAGLVAIPGALTPTEIWTAHRAGADFVKVFPISAMGGARYIRLIRGPFPDVPLWVSGSVGLDEIEELLESGAQLLGLTSALLSDLPVAPAEMGPALSARLARAKAAAARARAGRVLITIASERGTFPLTARDIAALAADAHVPLETVRPDRRGQAVRIAPILALAGVPEDATLEVLADDGQFARTVPARSLYQGGHLHHATDGHPLTRADGGPLRLYVAGGERACDNVKGVACIRVVAADRPEVGRDEEPKA